MPDGVFNVAGVDGLVQFQFLAHSIPLAKPLPISLVKGSSDTSTEGRIRALPPMANGPERGVYAASSCGGQRTIVSP